MRFMRAFCAPCLFPERSQFYKGFADFANEDAAGAERRMGFADRAIVLSTRARNAGCDTMARWTESKHTQLSQPSLRTSRTIRRAG
jgi:hypothetical protein